jgi:hypothetical protein
MPHPSRTAKSGLEWQPFLPPIGELSVPAGYAASGFSQDDNLKQKAVLKLAAKILKDPLLQRQLSDRVYELLQEDLRQQRERSRNYGGYF